MTEPLTPLQRALTRKPLFWAILLVGLVADLATKAWAQAAVRPEGWVPGAPVEPIPVIPGVIAWKWAVNEGAAFSFMAGSPVLLASIVSIVLVVILVYAYRVSPARRWMLAALALVASGAIGNLSDRLLLGHVRDFIFFDFELPLHGKGVGGFVIPQYWPVFNVADMAILAGVAILMVLSFKKPEPEAAPPAEESPAESQAEIPAESSAETAEEADNKAPAAELAPEPEAEPELQLEQTADLIDEERGHGP